LQKQKRTHDLAGWHLFVVSYVFGKPKMTDLGRIQGGPHTELWLKFYLGFLHLLFYSSTYRKIFYLINISFKFLLLIFLIADSIDFSGSMILYSPQKSTSADLDILSDIIT